MTRREALKVLDTIPTIGEQVDALEMAIEALEREPCEDCVSREAVENAIKHAEVNFTVNSAIDFTKHKREVHEIVDGIVDAQIKALRVLPSVTPQPKMGRWIEKEVHSDKVGEWQSARCSVCDKYHTTPYMYYFSHYDYCPHCGAKMEVEE